ALQDLRERINRSRPRFFRYSLVAIAGAIAITSSGCWMAAIQFAPYALQGAEYVGSGLVHGAATVAEGVGMMAHGSSDTVRKYSKMNPEERDRCDQLAVEVPGVIE